MPIVLPADSSRPLEQGDILANIVTIRTPASGPVVQKSRLFVLVLSRPCNALRDGYVVVAPIEPKPFPDLKHAESPRELVDAFERIRDGDGRPDGFYLGALDSQSSVRHVARLDELYTIEVPKAEPDRFGFLQLHRKFRLEAEYVRDLHLRVFRAFSSLGFDDTGWWSDQDLELVVRRCDAWIHALDKEAEALREDYSARAPLLAASGEPGKAENLLNEQLSRVAKKRRQMLEQYEPQLAEWRRRQVANQG